MIEVFGRATSSNVQAVMWAIGELGLNHRRHDLGHRFGGLDTSRFRAMNPHGLIPVIRDDEDVTIWETGAILRYLATRYGDDAVWPCDAARRAQVYMWAEWAKTTPARLFTAPIFWALVRTPKADRDPAAIAAATRAFDAALAPGRGAAQRLPLPRRPRAHPGRYPAGPPALPLFRRALTRAPLPALRAYYDRLTDRPAYCAHVMVSYDDLRA